MMAEETAAGYSASATKVDKTSHELDRVTIQVADNGGFSVSASYKPVKSSRKNEPTRYMEPVTAVFSDKAELDDYLDDLFGTVDDSSDDSE